MPFADAIGAIAGPVLGSVVGGLVSGGSSPSVSGGGPSYYTPTGLGTADTTWQGLLSGMNSMYGNTNLTPYAQASLGRGMAANDLYGGGYQNAANVAGGQYTSLGNRLIGQADQNFGIQNGLIGAGQTVYNMGL